MRVSSSSRIGGVRALAAVVLASASLITGALLANAGLDAVVAANAEPLAAVPVGSAARPASFADVIEAVSPAVVNVSAVVSAPAARPGAPMAPDTPFDEFFRRFFERQADPRQGHSLGSGFIVDPNGLIVTNHHVVRGATELTVTLEDGVRYEAKIVGVDPKTDLALLSVESDSDLPYVEFGDSDSLRVGDWIVAIGNPFGLGGSATTGIVSARGRDIQSGPFDDFLQIDAPINRGNSGGPLFDLEGKVVGVNTAIFSPNGGNVGIGFAIPAALVSPIIDDLRQDGRVTRGWLGVSIQGLDAEIAASLGLESSNGALVASVVAASPAEAAGLRAGDVILGIDGEPITEVKDLTRRVAELEPGAHATFQVWRGGEQQSVGVEIATTPDADIVVASPAASASNSTARLGLELGELTSDTRERLQLGSDVDGALVRGIAPDSPAAGKGVRAGDVLVMVGQTPVADLTSALAELDLAASADRSAVLLQLSRGGQLYFAAIPLD